MADEEGTRAGGSRVTRHGSTNFCPPQDSGRRRSKLSSIGLGSDPFRTGATLLPEEARGAHSLPASPALTTSISSWPRAMSRFDREPIEGKNRANQTSLLQLRSRTSNGPVPSRAGRSRGPGHPGEEEQMKGTPEADLGRLTEALSLAGI